MSKTRNILVFIDWYLPGYKAGGPVQSIANLVERLPFQFWIVTSIFDHASTTPYADIEPNQWHKRRHNENVMYLTGGTSHALIGQIMKEQSFDRIYINSLFSLKFALIPLLSLKLKGFSEKVILAPRGMLKPGALTIKAGKKKWFLKVAKTLRLFNGITWAASNEIEKEEIFSHFGRNCRVRIAPNLSKQPQIRNSIPEKKSGNLLLFSVARVSPEKNILGGIEFLNDTKSGDVTWDIYGTLQNEDYLTSCREAAKTNPRIQINFKGELPPEQIRQMSESYHFMYLPTLGENFGHAIAEAFLNGVPVIISDKTPWQSVESEGAGWALPLDHERFGEVLQGCIDLNNDDYLRLCNGAASYGNKIANDPETISANHRLFEQF